MMFRITHKHKFRYFKYLWKDEVTMIVNHTSRELESERKAWDQVCSYPFAERAWDHFWSSLFHPVLARKRQLIKSPRPDPIQLAFKTIEFKMKFWTTAKSKRATRAAGTNLPLNFALSTVRKKNYRRASVATERL